jgi:hypothetical protein
MEKGGREGCHRHFFLTRVVVVVQFIVGSKYAPPAAPVVVVM